MKTVLKVLLWILLIILVLYVVLYVSALLANFGSHPIEGPKAMIEYIFSGGR